MKSWVNQARCASGEPGIDPKDFQVPLRGDSQNKAKLVCAECPVQALCLKWALEHNEIWGVWGGLDEGEIRRTLSVDSVGRYIKRCRAPGCPNPRCRARPSALEITKPSRLRCTTCGFEWRSSTSVAAVEVYLRSRRAIERRRLKLRAKATTARVPLRDTRAVVIPICSRTVTSMTPEDLPAALVAALKPTAPER